MRTRLRSAVLAVLAACSGGGGDPPPGGGGPPPGGGCTTLAPLACWSIAQDQYDLPLRAPIRLVSCSYSYEGEALTYAWAIESRPAASAAATLSGTGGTATLVADVVGDYVVALTVTDSCGSSTSRHALQPIEFAPWADAGDDRFVAFGDPAPEFALDGTGTRDANLDPLTWTWTITEAPAGSAATLVGADTATPRLTPDVPGSYELTLVVSDGTSSDEDVVVVGAYHPAIAAPVDPNDVEYSAALDRLVAIESYGGTSLWIVNPHDGSTVEVPLSDPAGAPINTATWALGLSPDGLYAAVSHTGRLSYVDLAAGTKLGELTCMADAGDVVLPGNGLAYVFPRESGSSGVQIVPLDGSAPRSAGSLIAESSSDVKPRANAAGTRLYAFAYSSIKAWNIWSGTGDLGVITIGTESPSRPKGGGPWLSPDGTRLYTGSGDIYRTSDFGRMTESLLLSSDVYGGLDWIADSAVAGKIVVVPFSYGDGFRVLDRDTFAILEQHAAPAKLEGGVQVGWMQYAFWKADGSGFYVVGQLGYREMAIAEY